MPKDNTRTEISRHRLLLLRSDFFFFYRPEIFVFTGKGKKKNRTSSRAPLTVDGLIFFYYSFLVKFLDRNLISNNGKSPHDRGSII